MTIDQGLFVVLHDCMFEWLRARRRCATRPTDRPRPTGYPELEKSAHVLSTSKV